MPEYTEHWLYLPMGVRVMAAKYGDEGMGFWFALINEIQFIGEGLTN